MHEVRMPNRAGSASTHEVPLGEWYAYSQLSAAIADSSASLSPEDAQRIREAWVHQRACAPRALAAAAAIRMGSSADDAIAILRGQ